MKIVMLGPQGSGKGTQAAKIAEKLNLPHISTGDIFRENIKNQTELGKLAQEYTNLGKLVPDEVTNKMIADRLSKEKKGFILDGYPRNSKQAKALEEMTHIDYVINIEISDNESVRRISGRRTCESCGEVFHTIFKKPKNEGVCDKCKGKLLQRDDDNEEVVRKRLEIYHEMTKPLVDFYRNEDVLIEINGEQPIMKVFKDIVMNLEREKE
ncbi:adenylate kinase [Candidatus Woesearchaeota archaeon]|nr:adenylate kinase [Candidatus Woesearchaeota archaeon]